MKRKRSGEKSTNWDVEILTALDAELTAFPDPAGATPITRLSDRLARLGYGTLELKKAMDAIAKILKEPPVKNADWWANVSYLLQKVPFSEDQSITDTLRFMVLAKKPENTSARAWLLQAYSRRKERFGREDLDRISEIKQTEPGLWLDALVNFQEFERAVNDAEESIKNDKLNATDLPFRLSNWFKRWRDKKNYILAINRWMSVSKNGEMQALLRTALAQFQYEPPIQPAVHTAAKTEVGQFRAISSGGSQFLNTIPWRTPRVNGRAQFIKANP